MKEAKESLVHTLGSDVKDIVFILSVDEHPDLALRSALEINLDSSYYTNLLNIKLRTAK